MDPITERQRVGIAGVTAESGGILAMVSKLIDLNGHLTSAPFPFEGRCSIERYRGVGSLDHPRAQPGKQFFRGRYLSEESPGSGIFNKYPKYNHRR